jgi:hypothetical protein
VPGNEELFANNAGFIATLLGAGYAFAASSFNPAPLNTNSANERHFTIRSWF